MCWAGAPLVGWMCSFDLMRCWISLVDVIGIVFVVIRLLQWDVGMLQRLRLKFWRGSFAWWVKVRSLLSEVLEIRRLKRALRVGYVGGLTRTICWVLCAWDSEYSVGEDVAGAGDVAESGDCVLSYVESSVDG